MGHDAGGLQLLPLHQRQERRHVVTRVADAHLQREALEERLARGKAHRRLHVDAHRRHRAAGAHRLDGLGERRLVAHALERDVGAVAAGERAELLGGIAAVQAHRLGAELRGQRQAVVHAVHGEDARGAEELGRLHGQ